MSRIFLKRNFCNCLFKEVQRHAYLGRSLSLKKYFYDASLKFIQGSFSSYVHTAHCTLPPPNINFASVLCLEFG